MTDIAAGTPEPTRHWGSQEARKRVKRRYATDWRLQAYGLGAIAIAMGLLCTLFASLIHAGYAAFTTTKVELGVYLDPKVIDKDAPGKANYRKVVRDAFASYFPEVTSRSERRELMKIISSGSTYILRDYVLANPDQIGNLVKISVPVSDPYDQLYKDIIPREIDALSPDRVRIFERMQQRGVISVKDGRGFIAIDAYIDPEIAGDEPASANYRGVVNEGLGAYFSSDESTAYLDLVGPDGVDVLQQRVAADPSIVGSTIRADLPLVPKFSAFAVDGESKMRNPRFASDNNFKWFDSLVERGLISTPFTWELFTNADSRFPELAGLAGALSGSFLALMVCFLLSFPIGIATAVYLEEFAPKNRWSDLIEVNINNLAAVPSVVFGLLGLAVFLNAFGLPRSAPLVGGMVLSLMTLPTIIVSTRAALKSVPPSIREAALGVGASKHQVMLHHVLPLAMPGILTGTIIGLAQALGETAPLLLIGMNAFIPSIENVGLLQPAMALPTQIFSWADSPERGFVSRTSAAILVLLGFLIIMNTMAVLLRNRLERKW